MLLSFLRKASIAMMRAMDSALIDLEILGKMNMEAITSHGGTTLETPSKRSYIERRL